MATAIQLVNRVLLQKLRVDPVTTLTGATGFPISVLGALNEVQDELADLYDWPVLKKLGSFMLSAGVTSYDLSSDFLRPLRFYWPDGNNANRKIELVGDEVFLNHEAYDTDTGFPYIVRMFGSNDATGAHQVEVKGAPDAITDGLYINYEYIKLPAPLTADASICLFPDLVMVQGAYMKIKVQNGDIAGEDVTEFLQTEVRKIIGSQRSTQRKIPLGEYR